RRALHLVPQPAGRDAQLAAQQAGAAGRAARAGVAEPSKPMSYAIMSYAIKPLSCDPSRVRGMSERLIVSHYENNYCGAVKRLNLIVEQLAGLDPTTAPGYLLNGLKREELVATNSMVLHELFFDGLGEPSEPGAPLREALARDFGSY